MTTKQKKAKAKQSDFARPAARTPRKIKLPDLPPLMLKWGGYTDIPPNKFYAELYEGDWK